MTNYPKSMRVLLLFVSLCYLPIVVLGFTPSGTSHLSRRSPAPHLKPISSFSAPSIHRLQASFRQEPKDGNFLSRGRKRIRSFAKKIRSKCSPGKLSKRTMLISFASLLVTLFVRPTMALAMGGMAGTKGPVSPMNRYALNLCFFVAQ
jgi:hypothetical protein